MGMGRGGWTTDDIPDQSGRIALVTGANTGLGFETAKVLAGRGATVVLGCRDADKAAAAAGRIRAEVDRAKVRVVRLDLASLASVRAAADEIRTTHVGLDLLVNNAGVMDVPYHRTEDDFELTLATNHLGPFALTGLLLARLLTIPGSRIVTVSSLAHQRGVVDFGDLQSTRSYDPAAAYAQSKLANLLFTHELQSRLRASGSRTVAVAAHPGNVRTELYRSSSALERTLLSRRLRGLTFWFAQDVQRGALPILRAAVDPSAEAGVLYGPRGWQQYVGHPVRVESSARSRDPVAQRRLWEVSERLTNVSYHRAMPPGIP